MAFFMKKYFMYFWKDKVFVITFVFTAISCFFITPSMEYLDYVDWKVPFIMFSLMVAVAGMYEADLFGYMSIKMVLRFHTLRWIALSIIMASFFLGMLVTNDAVLLTFVPFTILVTKQTGQEKYAITIIALQTIAANLGSALTPMGDPQNIYLYAYYGIRFGDFLRVMAPVAIGGFFILITMTGAFVPNIFSEPVMIAPKINRKKTIVALMIFLNALLCILRVYSEWIAIIVTVVMVLIFDRKLLKKPDYTLILTFIAFFIFTGNLGKIPGIVSFVSGRLENGTSVYLSGFFLSQFISNVPSSVLLATFTKQEYWPYLLQGVNVGAMGTLIASLASLIALKFVLKEFPRQGKEYILTYSFFCFIAILVITMAVFIFDGI